MRKADQQLTNERNEEARKLHQEQYNRFIENCKDSLARVANESTSDIIYLNNPSLEDVPRTGGRDGFFRTIIGWFDCGSALFKMESPPDIHPTHDHAWGADAAAAHGCTYLGLVVRDNDSWESVSQKLAYPLEASTCYSFSLQLAQSEKYASAMRRTGRMDNYGSPTKIQIWGGNEPCHFKELLAESKAIRNNEWQSFDFLIHPKKSTQIISIRAFYEDGSEGVTNGHILIDHLSPIVKIKCI